MRRGSRAVGRRPGNLAAGAGTIRGAPGSDGYAALKTRSRFAARRSRLSASNEAHCRSDALLDWCSSGVPAEQSGLGCSENHRVGVVAFPTEDLALTEEAILSLNAVVVRPEQHAVVVLPGMTADRAAREGFGLRVAHGTIGAVRHHIPMYSALRLRRKPPAPQTCRATSCLGSFLHHEGSPFTTAADPWGPSNGEPVRLQLAGHARASLREITIDARLLRWITSSTRTHRRGPKCR